MDGSGPRVALLVDGDNIPAREAGRLLLRAGRLGSVIVKRAYVDPAHAANWCGSQGFGLRLARQGRDAADLLLAIDAVDLAHRGDIGAIAIASTDGGFAPLAIWLVERGLTVLGLGRAGASLDWRRSCTRFEELPPRDEGAAAAGAPLAAIPARIRPA